MQTAYRDIKGGRRQASADALLAALVALGAPIGRLDDVPDALRAQRLTVLRKRCEPVTVAWAGRIPPIKLRVPSAIASHPIRVEFHLETEDVTRTATPARVRQVAGVDVDDERFATVQVDLPDRLPPGYHRCVFTAGRETFETLIISAPQRAYGVNEDDGRAWGVFLPLYALRSERNLGLGDFGDLHALMEWAEGLGGKVVATLPLLAAFLDQPFDPSPYAPASRLFWNELYLDLERIPELNDCPAAKALISSDDVRSEAMKLRRDEWIDYRRQMALKRRILEELSRWVFTGPEDHPGRANRRAALDAYVTRHPRADDYARFRAVCERQRHGWPVWPEALRDGAIRDGDYDEEVRRYHLYVQSLADEQLSDFAERVRSRDGGVYLDLPLGAHSDGYDVWRERQVFALEAAGGAPPDALFTGGQNWGFPPLHPERLREQGYRYYIACIRHHLDPARILRIDHIMGLHRLFWIPRGIETRDGIYVRYAADEFYGILTLESHRHQAIIVGEDLGIVPDYVRQNMRRHHIHQLYVVQYEMNPEAPVLNPVPARALAEMNTHDMPPFAAFWEGLDLLDRLDLGLLAKDALPTEQAQRRAMGERLVAMLRRGGWLPAREERLEQLVPALLRWLAQSKARIVVVNLEDLWLERRPHNVPGTSHERPNWQRKARYTLEEFTRMPDVVRILREVARLRREPTPQ